MACPIITIPLKGMKPADLAGSLFPSAKGYKVVPQGEEFGGLLDGEEN